jgi:hypothetical protein
LFKSNPVEKPDFELKFPTQMTKKLYVIIVKKIFAVLRFQIYKAIRAIVRGRQGSAYLTKNEVRDVLGSLDMREIRTQVFKLYSLEYDERSMVKAYYTFMSDRSFSEQVRQAK